MEDRLKFYETGDLPRKNVDVMAEAVEEAKRRLRRGRRKTRKEEEG